MIAMVTSDEWLTCMSDRDDDEWITVAMVKMMVAMVMD